MKRILRIALGLLFVAAGLTKILHVSDLAKIVSNYHLLPGAVADFVAVVLPWIELVVGTCLVVGFLPESGALLAGLLGLSFAAANSSALWRQLDISCGCFSANPAGARLGWAQLVLDLVVVASSALLFVRLRSGGSLDPQGHGRKPANPGACDIGESLS